jgi:predicted ATPase
VPAYVTDFEGTFLIEEPENGIHPKAAEAVYQSLSSVYAAQVLMATHSPVMLSLVEPDQVLCFAKDEQGATDIVVGSRHPALAEWHGEPNLNVLFAAGVLS